MRRVAGDSSLTIHENFHERQSLSLCKLSFFLRNCRHNCGQNWCAAVRDDSVLRSLPSSLQSDTTVLMRSCFFSQIPSLNPKTRQKVAGRFRMQSADAKKTLFFCGCGSSNVPIPLLPGPVPRLTRGLRAFSCLLWTSRPRLMRNKTRR